jgi:hypothetical protein
MRSTSLILGMSVFAVALLAAPAHAADAILSGSIKSPAGEAMGGIMVSAKPQGGTITTTVLTDESGRYYFPTWARRKSRTSRFARWRISSGNCRATPCWRRCRRTTNKTSA